MLKPLLDKGIPISLDTQILATAIDYDTNVHPDETVFITNDLALKHIANLFFGEDSIQSIKENQLDNYCGYKDVNMSDEEMELFYTE